MKVEPAGRVPADYLDVNLLPFCTTHIPDKAERRGVLQPTEERGKDPRSGGEGGAGGRRKESLWMILHFNYLCKNTQPGLLGGTVSRFFISRAVVSRSSQPCAAQLAVPAAAMWERQPPHRRPSTHPSSFILLMDIPAQTSASLPDCNPLNFNSLYI